LKTQEELQREVIDQGDAIGSALDKLKKANMILSDWTQEYGFIHQPDPRKAMESEAFKSEEGYGEAVDSRKWFHEYNRIYQFIDIVYDYVYESKKILEKALG
jgi:hypothetical protein